MFKKYAFLLVVYVVLIKHRTGSSIYGNVICPTLHVCFGIVLSGAAGRTDNQKSRF